MESSQCQNGNFERDIKTLGEKKLKEWHNGNLERDTKTLKEKKLKEWHEAKEKEPN